MEHLKLENQLCFPIYATSRMITRIYQPYLEKLDLTYPQFLVMMVMWEHNSLTVGQIGSKLYLNTNTITPILKKLISKKYISKQRSVEDERIVHISLTDIGKEIQKQSAHIPECIINASGMSQDDLITMKTLMDNFLNNVTSNKSLEIQDEPLKIQSI